MMLLSSPDETHALGARLGAIMEVGDVIALEGALGAGKTVLAKGVLAGLGFQGDVPSPSYPLVIPYDPPATRIPLAHVDLYRVDEPSALEELALEEARGAGALVIEWPDRMGSRAWSDMLILTLAMHSDGARALTAQVPPAWERRWPPK